MEDNRIIKNQWYLVNKDNIPYLYVSVKKDFYTEAIRISDGTLLVGYFDYYNSLNLFILNDAEMIDNGRYISSIAIAPKVYGAFDLSGTITASDYKMYEARDMDEDGSTSLHPYFCTLVNENMSIVHITDEKKINDINFYIRQSRNALSVKMKENYRFQQKNRYGKLKESISDIRYDIEMNTVLNFRNNGIHWDIIVDDLKKYLKTLQSDSDYIDDTPKKKERWRNNKDKKKMKKKKD